MPVANMLVNKENKKIKLLLHTRSNIVAGGGVGYFLYYLSMNLDHNKFEITVLNSGKFEHVGFSENEYRSLNERCRVIPYMDYANKFDYLYRNTLMVIVTHTFIKPLAIRFTRLKLQKELKSDLDKYDFIYLPFNFYSPLFSKTIVVSPSISSVSLP